MKMEVTILTPQYLPKKHFCLSCKYFWQRLKEDTVYKARLFLMCILVFTNYSNHDSLNPKHFKLKSCLHFRVKHQQELVGKSTATHACILAPDQVKLYEFPVSFFEEVSSIN